LAWPRITHHDVNHRVDSLRNDESIDIVFAAVERGQAALRLVVAGAQQNLAPGA
jgi:hypothetical protein